MTKKFEAIKVQSGYLNPLTLILDYKTRWNSTVVMLERILKLKQPVINFLVIHGKDVTEPGDDTLTITSEAWNRFSEIMNFLKPFNEATIMPCVDTYPTFSVVVPLYIQRPFGSYEYLDDTLYCSWRCITLRSNCCIRQNQTLL